MVVRQKGPTTAQRSAITHQGSPLIIVAGPGTGKTFTLVRRAAFLIDQQNIDPGRMFLSTFTNKATEELQRKVSKIVDRDAFDMHVSTIHSFCGDLLRDFDGYHDWGANFRILDRQEQFTFLYNNYKDLGLKDYKSRYGGLSKFLRQVISFFNLCTEEQVNTGTLLNRINERGHELLGLKKKEPEATDEYQRVTEAYEKYTDLLQERNLIDFGHLQAVLYDMITRNEDARRAIADRFDHFLIDEYQDTNRIQVEIIRKLTAPNHPVTAVGDDDQAIYRFRGATVSSFLQFEKDFPGATRLHLDCNFRSLPPILSASESLIRENEPHRDEKHLEPDRDLSGAEKLVVFRAETCGEEADRVTDYLLHLRENGDLGSYSEVALLFRSVRSHSDHYLDALDEKGIDYEVSGEGGFFEREDIMSLRDLFKFCSWKRKVELDPLKGVLLELSPETIRVLEQASEKPNEWTQAQYLRELGIEEERDRRILRGIGHLRERWNRDDIQDLLEVFYDVLSATDYFEKCCPETGVSRRTAESEAALLNLAQFSQILEKFLYHRPTNNEYRFRRFLQNLPENEFDDLRPDKNTDAIQIMTVHQAKGLEFPVVVLGSATQSRVPGRFRRPKYPIPGDLRLSNESITPDMHVRDERRLFYVGMTRAQDLLLIGAPGKINKRGQGISQFVREINEDCLREVPAGDTEETFDRSPAIPNEWEQHTSSLPDTLSYSALNKYMLCPLWYKLRYDCAFSTVRPIQRDQLEFGKALHLVLEKLHGLDLGPQEREKALFRAHELLEEIWEPANFLVDERENTLYQSARDALTNYVDHHLNRLERIHSVERDVKFPTERGVLITGRVDLVCESGDGLELIDFKVRTKEGLDVLQPRRQVETYALALEDRGETPVEKITLHLLLDEPGEELVDVPWNDERRRVAMDRLDNVLDGIEQREFEATPGDHCEYCDFRNVCPESAVEATTSPEKPDLEDRIEREITSENTVT